MQTQAEVASLDQIVHHLHRAKAISEELRAEQHGMPETHILEGLVICETDIDRASIRLHDLIAWVEKGKAA